jgi:hypothetical protein
LVGAIIPDSRATSPGITIKEVLHRTKHLGWGSDTHLYRSTAKFGVAFPRY